MTERCSFLPKFLKKWRWTLKKVRSNVWCRRVKIMARLLIQTEGLGKTTVELHLGVNRVGRDKECEIYLPHASVSWFHAELALTSDGVHLQDNHSTNGTFIDGHPCTEAWLEGGQQIRFGHVETFLESSVVNIAIPQFDRTEPKAPTPVLRDDGRTMCARHPENATTFRCTVCKEHMCNVCVKLIRLQKGKPHFLCRVCSNPAERLDVTPVAKRNTLLTVLDTVKLKLNHVFKRSE